MKVSEVVALARQWVEQVGSGFPGFRGAYLAGSINDMAREESFPLFKDVDVYVVVDDPMQVPVPQRKFLYEGVLLESVCSSTAEYAPEAVLASHLAENVARGEILSDPTGFLSPLQTTVAADYALPQWVAARCDRQKMMIAQVWAQADLAPDAVFFLGFTVLFLAGLVTLPTLKSPTVRRCLVLTGDILEEHGRTDLQADLLALMGSAHMEREEVVAHLEECTAAFDRAVEVIATPFYASWNIDPGTRRYLVEGSYEMIDAGRHREAMFWISMMHCVANMAIQNDAPESEKAQYREGMEKLRTALGIGTADDWKARMDLARTVSDRVHQFADELLARST